MAQQSFQRFFTEVQRLFEPLILAPDKIIFFQALGWDISALTGGNASSFTSLVTALSQSVGAVDNLVTNPPQTFNEFKTALNQLTTLKQALQGLSTSLVVNATAATALPGHLVNKLIIIYLRNYQPILYETFSLLGIIAVESAPSIIDSTNNVILYQAGLLPELTISRLKNFIQSPADYIKTEYWPNGLLNQSDANAAAEKIFPFISRIAFALGINFKYGRPAINKPTYLTVIEWEEMGSIATLLTPLFTTETVTTALSVGLGLLPATAFPSDGAGFFIAPQGNASFSSNFKDWLITTNLNAGVGGIRIHRNKIASLSNSNLSSVHLDASIKPFLQSANPAPAFIIGSPTATRFEIGSYSVKVSLEKDGQSDDFGVSLVLQQLRLVIASTDADSFLAKALQSLGTSPTINFNLGIAWTKRHGLHLSGSGSLETTITLQNSGSNQSTISFNKLGLGIRADDNGLELYATTGATIRIGPIAANIEQFGLGASLHSTNVGNFGPFDASIAFNAPRGVGIKIESDAITGGGYLYFNPTAHRYAGVANLKFRDTFALNAIGLLQTQLPNNQPGYSFILLITAQFSPIQLGMGFTLNGVGGVIGINRHVDTTFLLGLVRNGSLDQLLFPANVMDNPTAALAIVDNSFPAIEDRYVFGLMAKIGWGTPTLITLDVALIIELPAPVRLIILGILKATLPDLNHPVLRLKAAFLGVIDFANQRISFDATLYDSGILMFSLSGDIAFRLYQGNNPVFVLTAGGFHPAFQPPANANLPALRRLTLSLADSSDFRLILTSYFAVTSNTVQFGSRLDLYVHLFSSCTLEGFLYFDALFHFNPFSLNIQIGGGVAIKWNGSTKFSISLRLTVTGPGPWHVWGVGEFDLFCWSYTEHIDKTFGAGASQPPLIDVNVRALLQAAIADKGNWEMQVPSFRAGSPVVLRPAEATGKLLVDPSGTLTFHQRLVPLKYQLDLYGNARPTQGNRFDIVSVVLGNQTLGPIGLANPYNGLVETRDYFSPGQFQQLNDGQKLSSASFQLMANGFQLYGPQGYASGPAAIRGVEYELIVLAASANGGSSDNSAQRSSGDEPAPKLARFAAVQLPGNDVLQPVGNARQVIAPDTYQRLAKNSAIGRAYADEQQSYRAPNKFTWHDDEYTVVRSADLSPYLPGNQAFGSEAEATAFLNTEVGSNPQLLGELIVVPAYQFAL